MSNYSTPGFCYLRIFSAINGATGVKTYDLSLIRKRFGRYPHIRRVFSYLYASAPWDCYVPPVVCVHSGMYHVLRTGEPVLLSNILVSVMFSKARIGGLGDNDDQAIRVNQGVATFAHLCETGGLNLEAALADASKRHIAESLRDPMNSLRDVFRPLVEHKLGEKRKRFQVDFAMLPQDIAALQRAFPELDVVVTGRINHPHAMSAASRLCSEEWILRNLHYSANVKGVVKGDGAYLIDVGANYVRHVKKNRFNIHCCVPCVDVRDSARETERVSMMRALLREKKIGEKTYRDYVSPTSFERRCMRLSQDCDVKATYGMAMHSQYDIRFDDLARIFDSHRIEIFWSVINFDVKIFYKSHGCVTEQRINFVKRNGRIWFSFSNDPSLNYSHDLNDYMRILTEQVIVTPSGRVYLIERNHIRCGNMFIKFTYCRAPPMTKELRVRFGYWAGDVSNMVIATWDYSDSFFLDSKFKTRENPVVSFTRKYIEIDKRFFELLYGHCLRSGDKSFNLNEIFSAALTFNTRMTINGNDIRTLNRVPSTDLMDVVVAVYCIAYRERYAAGKKIERFVADEKEKRTARRIGFSDVMRCLVRVFAANSIFDTFKECWNKLVDTMANIRARSTLDAEFFESIRCVEIEEFVTIEGDYKTETDIINSVNTDTVDVQMKEGFLDTIVNYTRRKYMCPEEPDLVGDDPLLRRHIERDAEELVVTPTEDVVEPEALEQITSKRQRKGSVYSFHKVMATRSTTSAKELAAARREPHTKHCSVSDVLKMPGDGHCLFWSLGYHLGLTAKQMRSELWKHCTSQEREEMPFINIYDGSFEGMGRTDCLRVFSRVYEMNVCVHALVDGKSFVTSAYSDENDYDRTVHLAWTTAGESGHVDVLLSRDVDDGREVLRRFLVQHDLDVPVGELEVTPEPIDAVYDYIHRHGLKRFSITRDCTRIGRYINRSAYKLKEILRYFQIDLKNRKVLDLCGAPGGFVQICIEEFAGSVLSVSLGEYSSAVAGLDYVSLIEGDLGDQKFDRLYDIVLADGGTEESYRDFSLFQLEVTAAKSALKDGGVLVIKHGNYFKVNVSNLVDCFRRIVYYKPVFSCEGNSEVYLICFGYSLVPTQTEIVDEETDKFYAGIRRYLSRQSNYLTVAQMSALLFSDEDVFSLKKKTLIAGSCEYHYSDVCECYLCTKNSFSSQWWSGFLEAFSGDVALNRLISNTKLILEHRLERVLDKFFLPEARVTRLIKNVVNRNNTSGFNFADDCVIAPVNPPKEILKGAVDGLATVLDAVAPLKERNDVVSALRPGRGKITTPTVTFNTVSYGFTGRKSIDFDGVATTGRVKLGRVETDIVRTIGLQVVKRRAERSYYSRTVALGGEHVQVISHNRSLTSGARSVDASTMTDNEEKLLANADVIVDRDVEECVSEDSASVSSLGESVVGSDQPLISSSRSGYFKKLKERLMRRKEAAEAVTMNTSDVLDALSDGVIVSDLKVMVSEWFAYPAETRCGVAFVRAGPGTYDLPQGLRQMMALPSPVSDGVLSRFFSRVRGDWSGYFSVRPGFHQMIVLVEDAAADIGKFLVWLPERAGTVALEVSVDINILLLSQILDSAPCRFHVFSSRRVDMRPLMQTTMGNSNGVAQPLVFPKLNNFDLGMARSPDYLTGHDYRTNYLNSMIEFRHSTSLADTFNAKEYEYYITSINDNALKLSADVLRCLGEKSFNLYDNVNKCWMVSVSDSREYMYGYTSDGYVKYDSKYRRFQTDRRYVLVSRKTEVMLNQQITDNIGNVDITVAVMPAITWINGPPGCGKTTHLIDRFVVPVFPKTTDIILTLTKEGAKEIREKLSRKYPFVHERIWARDVRTVASVLVNGVRESYTRAFIDEALMMHAGTIGFLVALTSVSEVYMIGDVNQIPYIDRDQICPIRYSSPSGFAKVSQALKCSYRCPVDVVYSLSKYYEGLYSKNSVVLSMSRKPYTENATLIQKDMENTLYLVHLQADKDHLIRQGYGVADSSRVLTVHEAQGLTFKHTVLIRTNPKPLLIFDRVEFAIVAVSRHTRSFVYYTDVSDSTVALIDSAESMDEQSLKMWNLVREMEDKPVGGDYYQSDVLMLPDSHAFSYEEPLLSLPHVSHSLLRPMNVGAVVSNELRERPWEEPEVSEDVRYLQLWYDDKFPDVASNIFDNDQLMVEMSDIQLFTDRVTLDPVRGVMRMPKYDKLRPVLRTMIPADRLPSQSESLLGAIKRNLNAPDLVNGALSAKRLAEMMVRNFIRSAIPEESMSMFESFVDNPVELNAQIVDAWLAKQPPAVRKNAVSDVPLHLRPFNHYNYMIKSKIKPPLEIGAAFKYASVQTIAYYAKSLNVVFCPIFNQICERFLSVITDKILILTNMSNPEFEREMNRRMNSFEVTMLRQIENDMSKYDKAQGEVLRYLEDELLRLFGFPEELLEIWRNSHVRSVLRDRQTGVKFETEYQRKSGDASTFFGNTLVLICVLLSCYDIDDISLLLAAGDDSVIFFKSDVTVNYDPSSRIADLFNLESKLMTRYSVPYFCSKFIVVMHDWIYFVPDPVKFLTKLGRRDMSNYEHVEDYRVSCLDMMSPLFNARVHLQLSIGIAERYKGQINDVRKLISIFKTLCSNPVSFSQLFIEEEGMKLCYDPSRSKLD